MKYVVRLKIKEILKERKMTQKELSRRTRLRESTISEIVRGSKTSLNFEHFSKIAEALEISDISKLIELKVTKQQIGEQTKENKKWCFRKDILELYINNVSSKTFQDAEDRLNYLEESNITNKIDEYINELDNEINRCEHWLEIHMNSEAYAVSEMEGRIETLKKVKNDLESRVIELI